MEILIIGRLLVRTEQRAQMLASGEVRSSDIEVGPPRRAVVHSDAHLTWLLAALDLADGDTAWGLIDLGIGMPGLGGGEAI